MNTVLAHVAGKNIEDLTIVELKAIASNAGRKAFEKAKKRGARVTELRNGQLVWVSSDGRTEPVRA